MKVAKIEVENFRGIRSATLHLPTHAVLIGDNNTGKTTVLEALDLVLGPDRLNRRPPINEHDFFEGRYIQQAKREEVDGEAVEAEDGEAFEYPEVKIEAVVVDLSSEQLSRFGSYIEFWDQAQNELYDEASPEGVDEEHILNALRVTFVGKYNADEDDFEGTTYYSRSLKEDEKPVPFSKKDKQLCGFLYLRSVRTGSRALSLEHGSLLDIILRLKEVRPRMWEETISSLDGLAVASNPEVGISGILESINASLKKYVPREWGVGPHLKVSNLTRDHLRKVITAFIATGNGEHAAPFYRQGTGTINLLVLAMLSQIAADKQNVIFAMEEPETAVPPYAQKQIIHEVKKLASQTIFTSHSPYVLEEYDIEQTVVLQRSDLSVLEQKQIELPDSIKLKMFRQDFRKRFCEGLLSRRVLVAEGYTETDAFPTVCRRLADLDPSKYSSLEALGICTVNAIGETNIPAVAKLYGDIGKRVFALCDLQKDENKNRIVANVEQMFMHAEKGFEELVLSGTTEAALKRFRGCIDWPQHLQAKFPDPEIDIIPAMKEYFSWSKASWGIADFLAQCSENEVPEWLRETAVTIKKLFDEVETFDEGEEGDPEAHFVPYVAGTARIQSFGDKQIYTVEADELDWAVVSSEERGMGPENHYQAIVHHDDLGELSWNLWEYPVGGENRRETNVGVHEILDDLDYGFEWEKPGNKKAEAE
ncbi:AAA family ATPase [Kordiimonas sp. SCSIO 12603]|nr:AAA family ATPase [Kordiimonas sp. SCSIO 12603]UTW59532.1 AAA family ATPase [Kordiimonas sp. SCSIO 12603]